MILHNAGHYKYAALRASSLHLISLTIANVFGLIPSKFRPLEDQSLHFFITEMKKGFVYFHLYCQRWWAFGGFCWLFPTHLLSQLLEVFVIRARDGTYVYISLQLFHHVKQRKQHSLVIVSYENRSSNIIAKISCLLSLMRQFSFLIEFALKNKRNEETKRKICLFGDLPQLLLCIGLCWAVVMVDIPLLGSHSNQAKIVCD